MRKTVKFFVMLQRFVADTVASGKKKNRRAEPVVLQFRDHLPAVFVWQHDVDDEQIELGRVRG
jgi:hypothetical protein